jgi:hypothetical protein
MVKVQIRFAVRRKIVPRALIARVLFWFEMTPFQTRTPTPSRIISWTLHATAGETKTATRTLSLTRAQTASVTPTRSKTPTQSASDSNAFNASDEWTETGVVDVSEGLNPSWPLEIDALPHSAAPVPTAGFSGTRPFNARAWFTKTGPINSYMRFATTKVNLPAAVAHSASVHQRLFLSNSRLHERS